MSNSSLKLYLDICLKTVYKSSRLFYLNFKPLSQTNRSMLQACPKRNYEYKYIKICLKQSPFHNLSYKA